MKLPFFGGAYQGRSISVNSERCLNFFLEQDGQNWILVGTPGLTRRLTLEEGPVRGFHFFNDHIIAVSGNTVYRIDSEHNAVALGTIASTDRRVSMADNGIQVLIVDGSPFGYYIEDDDLIQIDDEDFSGGTSATFQDGYFIVTERDSGRFRISDLYTAATWLESDFASAEGMPDKLRRAMSDHRELWLLGVKSGEVFYNSGDADMPFARTESGYIEKGIVSGETLAKLDNSLAWLSEDDRGHGLLQHVVSGYRPQTISPTGINWQWQQYSTISDAFAFTYQIEGHEFYVLTFPTENATWVYDAVTKQWHRWSSNLAGNEQSRHRANCHVFAFGRHYVGDYVSGKVYTIDTDVYTEDGETIIRERIGQHIGNDNERIPISEIQINFEEGVGLVTGQGSDPQAMLRWSKDRGRTWSNELWRSVGKIGEFLVAATWRKPGSSRAWSFWLRVSEPVKWVVRDATFKLREV